MLRVLEIKLTLGISDANKYSSSLLASPLWELSDMNEHNHCKTMGLHLLLPLAHSGQARQTDRGVMVSGWRPLKDQ